VRYVNTWELAGFDLLRPEDKCPLILAMVRCLVDMALIELPLLGLPPLYQSGVRYAFQPRACDKWKDAAEVWESGEGSCNSLVAYRVAELLLQGVEAGPYVQEQVYEDGAHDFHVILWRDSPVLPGRRWECPSRRLGMPAVAPPEFA
jgi:hypothetical protein